MTEPATPVEIDGAIGEGGGQVLRSSLTLSLALRRPFRMSRIRAGRPRPGLARQHLAAVRAAAEVGAAEVAGAQLGSAWLEFRPTGLAPGRLDLDIGSAGSACLVVQTLLPALARCDVPSRLHVVGGTHNPGAPPYDFLAAVYLPVLARLGVSATARLERYGFEPAGGGVLVVDVAPAVPSRPLELLERGRIRRRRARAVVAGLPRHVAERELAVVADRWTGAELVVEEVDADGPGNVLLLEIDADAGTEVVTGFGRRGRPAEQVATAAVAEAARHVAADVPVGRHLADQLLVPLALGPGGRFVCPPPSAHFSTNVEVVRRFLDVDVSVRSLTPSRVEVAVGPGRAGGAGDVL